MFLGERCGAPGGRPYATSLPSLCSWPGQQGTAWWYGGSLPLPRAPSACSVDILVVMASAQRWRGPRHITGPAVGSLAYVGGVSVAPFSAVAEF